MNHFHQVLCVRFAPLIELTDGAELFKVARKLHYNVFINEARKPLIQNVQVIQPVTQIKKCKWNWKGSTRDTIYHLRSRHFGVDRLWWFLTFKDPREFGCFSNRGTTVPPLHGGHRVALFSWKTVLQFTAIAMLCVISAEGCTWRA